MRHRQSVYPFGFLAVLCCAAVADPGASPVGTWSSGRIVTSAPPWVDPVELVVSRVGADQRVEGRFVTFPVTDGRFRGPGCHRGSVSGTFDGVALKVASPASNLCAERVFDLRLEGERLVGRYTADVPGVQDVVLTRKQ
ncbi:MAG: hypothetical protein HY854_09180 [Burkholderiales bacterium]|nr:hypothetical protein [Burkholderiales bacterium]